MDLPHIEIIIDLEKVAHQLKAHGLAGAIYFSEKSCWWTHHRSHARQEPKTGILRCPLGGMVFMEKDWEAWLEAARDNPDYYGKHGLKALEAAHHTNCRDPKTGAPFAHPSWRIYNAAIDAMLEEEKGLRKTAALKV